MIYELRTYTLHPGAMPAWLKLYEDKALPVFASIEHMTMVGYFRTETGVLNRVVHLWSYPDLALREVAHRALNKHPDWLQGFAVPSLQYLASQEVTLLSPVRFSPLK